MVVVGLGAKDWDNQIVGETIFVGVFASLLTVTLVKVSSVSLRTYNAAAVRTGNSNRPHSFPPVTVFSSKDTHRPKQLGAPAAYRC